MIDALVASDELPMVNEDTPANVKTARDANSKRISKLMKRLWNDAEWRKSWYEKRWGKNRKKKLEKVFKDNWKDPVWKANWMAARWSDAQRAEHSDLVKSQWSDTRRAEHSDLMKSLHQGSESSEKMKASSHRGGAEFQGGYGQEV
jgi:hypothetical protein